MSHHGIWIAAALLGCATPALHAAGSAVYTATAYTTPGETASGKAAQAGLVAADPDLLPLGSRIRVSGAGKYSGVYTVADTGRKIQGREIDIYIPNNAEAKRFGKKRVKVTKLSSPPGS